MLGATLPTVTGEAAAPGVAGPVCGALDNKILVAGGANFPDAMPWQGGQKKYHDQVYVFSGKDHQLKLLSQEGRLPEPIAYAASCPVTEGIVYAGGENDAGISDKVFLIRNDLTKYSIVVDTLPRLPAPVTNAAAVSLGSVVFVAGGEGPAGVSDKVWSMDLHNLAEGWKPLANLPKPVSHAVLVAFESDGGSRLCLLGGRRKTNSGISDLYSSVYMLHTALQHWKEMSPLPFALSAAAGVAAGSSSVYLFGGDQGTTFSKVEQLLVQIAQTNDASKKQQLIKQKNEMQASHPGFNKEILHYNIATGTCTLAGQMPFPPPVTTTAFWWDNRVIIPCGEIRAGVRTPQILMATLPPAEQ